MVQLLLLIWLAQTIGFPPEAKWNELKCSKQQVPEPNTAFTTLVGPTAPPGEGEAPNFNFNEMFDHPPFVALAKVVKVNDRAKPVHYRYGRLLYEEVLREEGSRSRLAQET